MTMQIQWSIDTPALLYKWTTPMYIELQQSSIICMRRRRLLIAINYDQLRQMSRLMNVRVCARGLLIDLPAGSSQQQPHHQQQ